MKAPGQHLAGRIVDLHRRCIFPGVVEWAGGRIVRIREDRTVRAKHFIAPGFVDAHIHIESSMLPPAEFARWSVEPIARIVSRVREQTPGVPVIVFPKGAGHRLSAVVGGIGPDAVGLDWTIGADFVRRELQPRVAVQGNIDPIALLSGGDALDRAVDRALESFAAGRYIFNLGHGILPPTPIAHVERMVERVRRWRNGA